MLKKRMSYSIIAPEINVEELTEICVKAIKGDAHSVSVPLNWVKEAKHAIANYPIQVVAKVSFPLGLDVPEQKLIACQDAVKSGATEIDFVCNMGFLKSNDFDSLKREIEPIVNYCHDQGVRVNAILEISLLNPEQIITTLKLMESINIDGVGTSVGFKGMNMPLVSVSDIEHIRLNLSRSVQLKATGITECREEIEKMISGGADIVEISRIDIC